MVIGGLGADALLAAALITRQVAVTFDDLPVSHFHVSAAQQQTVTPKLLRAIKAAGVPAIGFVNEGDLAADPKQVQLLEQWLDAGLELGNHTYSHFDLHHIDVAKFERDIAEGERVTRSLLKKRGRELRWFRHPFLHTGRSLETRTRVETFLRKRGVRVAPVTLDNSEWIFSRAYDNAINQGDEHLKRRLGREYLAYMDRKLAYFEQQSQSLFGRNIPHVLLLHANSLNADWFDELAASMKQRGYGFIPIERALADPAYRSPDTYTGASGLTWLHRWALTAKKPIVPNEPRVPQWVLDAAGMDSE